MLVSKEAVGLHMHWWASKHLATYHLEVDKGKLAAEEYFEADISSINPSQRQPAKLSLLWRPASSEQALRGRRGMGKRPARPA